MVSVSSLWLHLSLQANTFHFHHPYRVLAVVTRVCFDLMSQMC